MKSAQSIANLTLEYTVWPAVWLPKDKRWAPSVRGTLERSTLQELIDLHVKTTAEEKHKLPCISPGKFPSNSRARTVERPEYYTALMLDFDKEGRTLQQTVEELTRLQLAGLVYKTPSSNTEQHPYDRLRVLLPFSKSVTDEVTYARLRRWAMEHFADCAKESGEAKRPWYIGHLPGHPDDAVMVSGFTLDLLARPRSKLGGFDRAQAREQATSQYEFMVRLAMHLASTQAGIDVEEELRKEDQEHWGGRFHADHDHEFARLAESAAEKAARRKQSPSVDPTQIDTSPTDDADWIFAVASELKGKKPAPREFVIPGWIPKNAVTLLGGHGGMGKSFIAMAIAAALAEGTPILGHTGEPLKVVYVSAEDDLNEMHWRLHRYRSAYSDNLRLIDATKTVNHLVVANPVAGLIPTARYELLQEACRDADLLVLDSSADYFGGNENDRSHVKAFINMLAALCPSVLLLVHVDKATSKEAGSMHQYSGSTAWHNSVRSRLALYRLESGQQILEVQKANYAAQGLASKIEWSDEHKRFEIGEPFLFQNTVDELASILLPLIDKTDRVPTTMRGQPSFFQAAKSVLPPKYTAGKLYEKLAEMKTRGWLATEERKQESGSRTSAYYVLTNEGKAFITPTDKF